MIFQASLNYIIDTFQLYAASAVAAVTFLRSVFAAVFPLFAPPSTLRDFCNISTSYSLTVHSVSQHGYQLGLDIDCSGRCRFDSDPISVCTLEVRSIVSATGLIIVMF